MAMATKSIILLKPSLSKLFLDTIVWKVKDPKATTNGNRFKY